MGNKNLSHIRIDNYPERKNDLIISTLTPDKDKEAVNNEKQNMKLINKHNKECKDSSLIDECLISHCFLRALEKQARQEIIKEMSLFFVKANQEIFKQGDPAGCFYILRSGTCDIIINGEKKEILQKGNYFGDTAILYGTNREYTVKASTDCYVWIMEKKNFKKVIEHILHITYEDNNSNIGKIPLFSIASHDQKIKLANYIYRETHLEGRTIFEKGNISNCIYILKDGSINLKKEGKVIRTLYKGECLGALEAIANSNRITDATPKEKTHLLTIPINCLKSLYGENYRSVLALSIIKSAFYNNANLKKLNLKFLDEIFNLINFKYYERETEIIKSGEPKNSLIIVPIEGELIEVNSSKAICTRNNVLFGKEIYDEDTSKTSSAIKCKPYSLLAILKNSDLKQHFKCSLKMLGEKSSFIEQLKKVNLFKNFTNAKLENLSKKIKVEKVPNGKNVITQGEEGTRFYIIKKGLVDIFVKDKYIRTMNENEYLGERALFFKEPRSATAKAHGDVEVYYLEKNDFETVIEKNLKDYLKDRLYLQDNTVQLNDLIYYMKLGSGSYGNVSLVKSSKNKFFYAIKNISCKQILYSQLHANLELERSILVKIDHPFIVKLVKTMKDKNYVYFLMDYIKGKELFDVIRDIGLLNKFQTQFYGASIMLAVQYLHERKFIYRDIKPENIMVLGNGFIKLIDFGTAKAINDRTKTIIGTPHYMAPEVILGEGYSFKVDFWSIGICMYEFMCGGVPFGENHEEAMDVYLSIINE
jgi:cGMP-dependent protein kinase